jgi:hypothetical protein
MREPVEVIHNNLADPGIRPSLLLVRQGFRRIEIVRCEDEFVVVTSAAADDDPAQFATQNLWFNTLTEAADHARRLVWEFGP